MTHHVYTPQGTCSRKIEFDIENGKVYNIRFTGGCNGNLKGICALSDGKDTKEIISLLGGIQCGMKGTSCPDQLARALAETDR